ncbi:hypothetical protein GQ457_06G017310 [Hibiscus cannabinus]
MTMEVIGICVLDIDREEAKILENLSITRGDVARVTVVKKLIRTLGECFHDEKFVQVFGTPSRPLTDLRVVVAKVKHQDNGVYPDDDGNDNVDSHHKIFIIDKEDDITEDSFEGDNMDVVEGHDDALNPTGTNQ